MLSRSTQAWASNLPSNLRAPTRSSDSMPWRRSSHQSASDFSKQVEPGQAWRPAALIMRAVIRVRSKASRGSVEPSRDTRRGCARKRRRDSCVARKPRTLRLTAITGKSIAARKKIPRASESSELKRRRGSHIGRAHLQQTVFHQPTYEVGQILAQKFRLDIVFIEKLLIGHFDFRRRGHQLPHARARFIQTEVAFRFDIQQDGFFIEETHQHVRGYAHAIVERHHQ